MGLVVMHYRAFLRRYPALWGEDDPMPGSMYWADYERGEVGFDEEEIAALHAEALLKDPSPTQYIQDEIAKRLQQFVGGKMTDAMREHTINSVLRELERVGDVLTYDITYAENSADVHAVVAADGVRHVNLRVDFK